MPKPARSAAHQLLQMFRIPGDHLVLVRRRALAEAHSHAAEPDRRDFQIAASQFALLYFFLLQKVKSNAGSY